MAASDTGAVCDTGAVEDFASFEDALEAVAAAAFEAGFGRSSSDRPCICLTIDSNDEDESCDDCSPRPDTLFADAEASADGRAREEAEDGGLKLRMAGAAAGGEMAIGLVTPQLFAV